MAENELLIKISADAKNAQKAFDDVREQTEDLEKTLGNVAKISAVGFAVLTAEVGFSLKAFAEAEEAARSLNTALQAQGIFTEELADKYKTYATEVMNATGIDDDAITAAQATAQAYLGQTEITKELTLSIANMAAAKKIDLNSAAMLVAKTIGTETNALAREGLTLDQNATTTERYAKTLEFLEGRYKGQAAAANEGLGSIKGLSTAFGNLQEEIGSRFAPMAEKAMKTLTDLFKTVSENKALVDLTVALIAAGLAITTLGVAIPAAVSALGIMKAALAAFQIQTTLTKLAVQGLVAATGLGLLVVAATEIILNWDKVKSVLISTMNAIASFWSEFGKGFFKFVKGDFKEGFDQMRNASREYKQQELRDQQIFFQQQTAAANAGKQKQDAEQKAQADKIAKEKATEQARRIQLEKETQELIRMQDQRFSAAEIELQKAKIQTITEMQKTENVARRAILQEHLDEINADMEAQFALEEERNAEFDALVKEARDETDTQDLEDLTTQQEKKRALIEAGLLTEQEARQAALNKELAANVEARNKQRAEQIKYGAAYAAINKVINSDEVEGTKKAVGELVQLTQSKNATLKSIGKAAAVANIVIKTAESAMSIYAGFSTIPIIGPALGIAGAAAAIAFGAEQVGNVTAAASGALVHGSGSGDTVPFMLEPGELVAPKKNFEEVVAGTQLIRGMQDGGGVGGPTEIIIGFDGREAAKILTAKQNEDRSLGLSTAST